MWWERLRMQEKQDVVLVPSRSKYYVIRVKIYGQVKKS